MSKRPKFLVDCMLGRLAKWLRLLGFDAADVKVHERRRMLERSFLERRILVTREAKLEKAHAFKGVLVIRAQHWWDQLEFLWAKLKLGAVAPKRIFSRCSECNKPLKKILKSNPAVAKAPPKVYAYHDTFHSCPKCKKIFWPGTHLNNTISRLKKINIPGV